KTALACSLATCLTHFFHFASGVFAPLFVFLLMTVGMPTPRLNAIVGLVALVISSLVSAGFVIALHDAPYLYLVVTLVWIFTILLFANWFPLPASMGSMISAIGVFVFFSGSVGDTFTFYFDFVLDWLVGGSALILVTSLLWPHSLEALLRQRLAAGHSHLAGLFWQMERQIRANESPQVTADDELPPLPPVRPLPALELPRGVDPSHPLAQIDRAFQAMNRHLWFFQSAVAPVLPAALSAQARQQLADVVARCAEHLHALVDGILRKKESPVLDVELPANLESHPNRGERRLAHGVRTLWHRILQNLQTVTTAQNALVSKFDGSLAEELSALAPPAPRAKLIDANSVRRSTKLVLILVLCLVEQHAFGFPGGAQVAFFAVFFASVGNLGRQTKTDVQGVLGIVAVWAFALAAVLLTSKQPRFPLLLSLAFLGTFLAILAFQKLPRYGIASLQAGLALPYAFLASTGPSWGNFMDVRTRIWGIIVAGFTALVVHACFWPVLPMHRVRVLIAAALRDTAGSLSHLLSGRLNGMGSPAGLRAGITGAHELLDDAHYLPGSDGADPGYQEIVMCLRQIDACLEYLHLVLAPEQEHPLAQRFVEAIGDDAQQAGSKLEEVAQQFQEFPGGPARVEPVRWQP
ncbi:MAG TPA: hypothetical protein VHB77_17880, partial [Planctomycetaceae bacterium]|nr:hypothetical protein [Planctomycetaceae bacterium]